ncbi:MAG: hypothetical protein P4L70_03900, partial [Parasulfuritortus sp.]|nr:hypothetical protein [Parasulfuritortus sp.]
MRRTGRDVAIKQQLILKTLAPAAAMGQQKLQGCQAVQMQAALRVGQARAPADVSPAEPYIAG